MRKFEADVDSGKYKENGWSSTNYGMSKLGLIAYTNMIARQEAGNKIQVNSCCPGWCDTDMSSHKGPRPPAEGAKNAVILCNLPEDGPTGTYWADFKQATW